MSAVKVDSLQEKTAGAGVDVLSNLNLVEAANGRQGIATLAAGTKVTANTSVTANTRVWLSRKTQGTAPGHLSYTVSAGISFTITSSSVADDADIAWHLTEPA